MLGYRPIIILQILLLPDLQKIQHLIFLIQTVAK